MSTYTYTVQTFAAVNGIPGWVSAYPEPVHTVDWPGTASALAGQIMTDERHRLVEMYQQRPQNAAGQIPQWRVLVWEGEHIRHVSFTDADGWATYNHATETLNTETTRI